MTGFLVSCAGGVFLIVLTLNAIRDRKLKKSGMLNIDQITEKKFIEYLRVLFLDRG